MILAPVSWRVFWEPNLTIIGIKPLNRRRVLDRKQVPNQIAHLVR